MNTNTTASASATEATAADNTANSENTNASGAEQNANAGAEQTNDTKQEAPGGSQGEFKATWTLRSGFVRFLAKVFFAAAAYIGYGYLWGFLSTALFGSGIPLILSFPVGCILFFVMFFNYFGWALPKICKAVDYVADKATGAWTSVKGWFKKSEETAAAPAAAPAAA